MFVSIEAFIKNQQKTISSHLVSIKDGYATHSYFTDDLTNIISLSFTLLFFISFSETSTSSNLFVSTYQLL